jgi:hypothetical protein
MNLVESPQDIISEIQRLTLLLGPKLTDEESRKAYEEYSESLSDLERNYKDYELALHRLRQAVEKEHKEKTGG